MIEREIIEERLSQAKLKKLFSADPKTSEKVPDKVKEWLKRASGRIKQGRDSNFSKGKIYRALDLAWEQSAKQVNPTLIKSLLGDIAREPKDGDTKDVENILKTWGINVDDVIIKADPKVPGSKTQINIPAFFNVVVPICKGYTTIRWASIVNERNRTPFFEYDPAWDDEFNRLRTSVVTSRVEVMSRQMDYFGVLKQRAYNMLHYGQSLTFPMEEWYTEEQETEDEEYAAKNDKGKVEKANNRMYRIIKEGIRFDVPHLSRVFFDEFHRPSTFNTNTGCDHAGNWKVVRYGDVKRNKDFWNANKINLGNEDWWNTPNASAFFSVVYPCSLAFPQLPPNTGNSDRETKLATNLYSDGQEDMACVITNYFERLIPSEWDMGDYDYPIWMKFILAGDDTVLYAAPLGYIPIVWEGYDADENRANANSLSLETLSFQDQFSQLCTQMVLTCKQNLANMTFVDTDGIDDVPKFISMLENLGERFFRKLNFWPFSARKALKSQHGIPSVFHSVNLPKMPIQEIIQTMRTLLDIMERVLVMSAQEVGAAASHEQSKFEVQKTHEAKGTRLTFTATSIDRGNEAMKQMLYEALMYYGSDDFWVQIPYLPSLTKERLKELGFTWDAETHPMGQTDNKITVKVKKSAIAYLSFAERRDDLEIRDNPETAVAILNFFNGVWQTPMGEAIGMDQGVKILNMVIRLAGFPKDFKLENKMGMAPPAAQQKWFIEQLTQVRDGILQEVGKGMQQVAEPIVAKLQEHDAVLQKIVEMMLPPQPPQALPLPPNEDPTLVPAGDTGLGPMVGPDGVPLA